MAAPMPTPLLAARYAARKPTEAPRAMSPSMATFSTPERSVMTSPRAASSSGVAKNSICPSTSALRRTDQSIGASLPRAMWSDHEAAAPLLQGLYADDDDDDQRLQHEHGCRREAHGALQRVAGRHQHREGEVGRDQQHRVEAGQHGDQDAHDAVVRRQAQQQAMMDTGHLDAAPEPGGGAAQQQRQQVDPPQG